MSEPGPPTSLLERTRPRRPLGESSIALADKSGGGGIAGWIARARQERDQRQEWQRRQRQLGYSSSLTTSPDTADRLFAPSQPEAEEVTLSLDSNTLSAEVSAGRVTELPSGLLDLVALLGSTHPRANWREESVMPALRAAGVPHYTPRMEDWNPDLHPVAEALALSRAAVIGINIENRHFRDGSLGSMVEIGMSVLSAALNGQHVVICFEREIEKSLSEEGAVAQFRALREQLTQATQAHPELVTVIKDGDLSRFQAELVAACQAQRQPELAHQALGKAAFERHLQLKRERMQAPYAYDLFGGSSGSFSRNSQVRAQFAQEQSRIQAAWPQMLALNGYPPKAWWDYAEQQPANEREAAYYLAFKTERPLKQDARVLIWSIQDEAVSKAAITELGFLLLHALESGQQVMVLMEPFNVELYAQTVLREKVDELRGEVSQVVEAALRHNSPYSLTETTAAQEILERLADPHDVTPATELLKKNQVFTHSASNPDLLDDG